jgi:predicted ATP-dependent endonuclease of OLD family
MKHTYFEITNFKGIEKIRLEFNSKPNSRVYTLVGLNESGKTTILEAMHFFQSQSQNVNPLDLHGYTISDVHKLIPIAKRSNFNDQITIEVGYRLDDDDKNHIMQFLWEQFRYEVKKAIPSEFYIRRSYEFVNSKLSEGQPKTVWTLKVFGKSKKAKTEKYLDGEKWSTLISFAKTMLPNVLYFPNFLFEFPDRIYLENPPKEIQKHQFYREVLEDVLHATDKNASLEEHVIARIRGKTSWLSWDSETLDSVLSKMGSHITRTVFTQWNRIFKSEKSGRDIVIREGREPIEGEEMADRVYLQLRLKEGSEHYSISERSLGFRWFFAFLLFTQYRGFRGSEFQNNILFLFDEPASNLHSSAQSQLLDSFGKFPDNSSVIYTTHSHHLINPAWLEGAFVVKNEGLAYDSTDDDFDAANTKITLHKYREFASSHPDQTTYFQPILDVLDYCPSQLENVPNVVMLEGKNDFYTLKFMSELIIGKKAKLNLLPGGGSGALDCAIQLYLAWGRNFIVILDSDKAGKDQKSRYEDKFGILVENKIFALSDIDSKWKKISTEGLFTDTEKNKIQKSAYPTTIGFNKKHFNRAIQEAYLTDNKLSISKGTLGKFQKVIDFCSEKLKS